MKRIHLFEVEDFEWFPAWLRSCMTRLIIVMHRFVGTKDKVAGLLNNLIQTSGRTTILDYCSGSGGPMPEVFQTLKTTSGKSDLNLILSDLYPDNETINKYNNDEESSIRYITKPVDVIKANTEIDGIRTMIGSFHHFKPDDARSILKDAQARNQPICIFEISDNSTPIYLWWVAIPINFLMALFITPLARPMTVQQLLFTYLIPVIPLCFAWDGAVSNARTYTLDDLEKLLEGLESDSYKWEKGKIEGTTNQLYLIGQPV